MADGQTCTQLFGPLSPLETRIDAAVTAALQNDQRTIRVSASPDAQRIRGTFLRWLLLESIPETKLPIKRIELCAVAIDGPVDLAGVKLEFLPRFLGCAFDSEITLVNAEIIGFDLISTRIAGLAGDRLTARGSLEIRAGRRDEGVTDPATVIGRLRLNGAKIRGNLNLRGSRLLGHYPDDRERISMFADGLSVESNILLSGGVVSGGEIRLNGSTIQRNLDCSGATLVNHRGFSQSAAGARINGSVYLCHTQPWASGDHSVPFVSEGCVRFEGAKIIGDFDCSGGHFTAGAFRLTDWRPSRETNHLLYAIKAGGLEVGANIDFASEPGSAEMFVIKGVADLVNARVGGDFDCWGAKFDFPGEEPLAADGITVIGKALLHGIDSNGVLRFKQSTLKQGCYVRSATFRANEPCQNFLREPNLVRDEFGGPACGLYAPGADVGATFFWTGIRKEPPGAAAPYPLWLHVFGSKANAVHDDEQSWSIVDRFDVTGCQYSSISSINGDASWRLEQLDRQYAFLNAGTGWPGGLGALWRALTWFIRHRRLDEAIARFKPQPYIQLARTFRGAGYEKAANRVLTRLERNRTRYSDFGFFRQIWRWLLDVAILYGLSPFRPIVILVAWLVFSAGCFELAYHTGRIVSVKDPPKVDPGAVPPAPRPTFNALIYAVDTLVPIVDFNQKKSWMVEPPSLQSAGRRTPSDWWDAVALAWEARPDWGVPTLIVFNTFFGWLMTTLFAAGVSGLLRTARDG